MHPETAAIPKPNSDGRRRARAGTPDRGIFEKVPGSGAWWIRHVDAQGRYRREKAGTWSNADKLLTKRKNEALQGKKLPETLRCASVTFREIATEALAWSDAHKRSKRMDHSRMKKLLNWFGDSPLDFVTPQEIERRFQSEFRTSATWNRYRALLSLTYRLAIRNGKVKENPARLIPHKVEHNERTRILSVEEEKKLRPVILEKFPERLPEFELALHTGMRHCEQYGARWQDVDFDHRTLTVPRDKGGRTSHVRLNDAALSALLRLRERTLGTGYVCGGSAGETDWFEECLSTAGITGFSWHCLRHTFASRLVMAGADPRTVAELLRDKTLHMAMRYSHLAPDFTLDAVLRMERKFHADSTPVAPEPNTASELVH
jgi:integrase